MYYDLISSLPQLPHFEQAERLPITPLRLGQRLRRLRPEHGERLTRTRPLVAWRPQRLAGSTDAELVRKVAILMEEPLEPSLRDYVTLRMQQQTLLAALRRKRDGHGLPEAPTRWGIGPHVHVIRIRFETADFGLAHVYPWLSSAREFLDAGDAWALERLLMNHAWTWLTQCAERSMFSVDAAFSYVFRWDILQAWLACDVALAKARFAELVDKVTHVEHN